MKLILLGPPGAGKGTQAEVLSKKLRIPHISTGDMLREALRENEEVGQKAKFYMEKGELVPDDLVTEIVKQRLNRSDTGSGYILDGYPRTEGQADALDKALKEKGKPIDIVLYFKTSPAVSIKRLSGRRICPKCNANYHVTNRPPKKKGICNKCNVELHQRKDDKEETVKNRLEVYNQKTKGLIDYYKNQDTLREVPGDLEVDELFNVLADLFKKENLA